MPTFRMVLVFLTRFPSLLLILFIVSLSPAEAGKKREPKPDEQTVVAYWEKNLPEQADLLKALEEEEGDSFDKVIKQSGEKMTLLEKYLKMETTVYSDRLMTGLRQESKLLLWALLWRRATDEADKQMLKDQLTRGLSQAMNDQIGLLHLDIIRTQGSLDTYAARQDVWEATKEEMVDEFLRRAIFNETGWLPKASRIEKLDPGSFASWQKGREIIDLECQLTEMASKYRRETDDQERKNLLSEARGIVVQIYDAHILTVRSAVTSTEKALDQYRRKLELLQEKRKELIDQKLTQLLSGPIIPGVTEF